MQRNIGGDFYTGLLKSQDEKLKNAQNLFSTVHFSQICFVYVSISEPLKKVISY